MACLGRAGAGVGVVEDGRWPEGEAEELVIDALIGWLRNWTGEEITKHYSNYYFIILIKVSIADGLNQGRIKMNFWRQNWKEVWTDWME